MKRNYKVKALGLLNKMDLADSAAAFRLLYNIAATNPHAIVRAHPPNSVQAYHEENSVIAIRCCKKYWPNRKVEAIRELRRITDIGLIEASDLINKHFDADVARY